jgi:hypothetical protein
MVAGLRARGKSELHRAGCPVKAGEAGPPADSPDWRDGFGRRESNSDQSRRALPGGVKRAILPAAISELADKDGCSPRPKVESSHEGDDVTGIQALGTERDDHHEQNSAYSLLFTAPPLSAHRSHPHGASSSIG